MEFILYVKIFIVSCPTGKETKNTPPYTHLTFPLLPLRIMTFSKYSIKTKLTLSPQHCPYVGGHRSSPRSHQPVVQHLPSRIEKWWRHTSGSSWQPESVIPFLPQWVHISSSVSSPCEGCAQRFPKFVCLSTLMPLWFFSKNPKEHCCHVC